MSRLLRKLRSALGQTGSPSVTRTIWPTGRHRDAGGSANIGIVAVNFNTARLISQLVFSLYRNLDAGSFVELVVVDNASTDGSVELLSALNDAGLIRLIRNTEQLYHGPALTQGVSWLAKRQLEAPETELVDYVWVLDSDVVVLRPDTAFAAVAALEEGRVAAVGQLDVAVSPEDLLVETPLLHVCSLLFDPLQVWQPALPPFLESGLPSRELQAAAERLGVRMVEFPFVEEGYLVHLGRGTLRAIAERGTTDNHYHAWAVDHNDPHFAAHEDGPILYDAFCKRFDHEVGELTPEALVAACRP